DEGHVHGFDADGTFAVGITLAGIRLLARIASVRAARGGLGVVGASAEGQREREQDGARGEVTQRMLHRSASTGCALWHGRGGGAIPKSGLRAGAREVAGAEAKGRGGEGSGAEENGGRVRAVILVRERSTRAGRNWTLAMR